MKSVFVYLTSNKDYKPVKLMRVQVKDDADKRPTSLNYDAPQIALLPGSENAKLGQRSYKLATELCQLMCEFWEQGRFHDDLFKYVDESHPNRDQKEVPEPLQKAQKRDRHFSLGPEYQATTKKDYIQLNADVLCEQSLKICKTKLDSALYFDLRYLFKERAESEIISYKLVGTKPSGQQQPAILMYAVQHQGVWFQDRVKTLQKKCVELTKDETNQLLKAMVVPKVVVKTKRKGGKKGSRKKKEKETREREKDKPKKTIASKKKKIKEIKREFQSFCTRIKRLKRSNTEKRVIDLDQLNASYEKEIALPPSEKKPELKPGQHRIEIFFMVANAETVNNLNKKSTGELIATVIYDENDRQMPFKAVHYLEGYHFNKNRLLQLLLTNPDRSDQWDTLYNPFNLILKKKIEINQYVQAQYPDFKIKRHGIPIKTALEVPSSLKRLLFKATSVRDLRNYPVDLLFEVTNSLSHKNLNKKTVNKCVATVMYNEDNSTVPFMDMRCLDEYQFDTGVLLQLLKDNPPCNKEQVALYDPFMLTITKQIHINKYVQKQYPKLKITRGGIPIEEVLAPHLSADSWQRHVMNGFKMLTWFGLWLLSLILIGWPIARFFQGVIQRSRRLNNNDRIFPGFAFFSYLFSSVWLLSLTVSVLLLGAPFGLLFNFASNVWLGLGISAAVVGGFLVTAIPLNAVFSYFSMQGLVLFHRSVWSLKEWSPEDQDFFYSNNHHNIRDATYLGFAAGTVLAGLYVTAVILMACGVKLKAAGLTFVAVTSTVLGHDVLAVISMSAVMSIASVAVGLLLGLLVGLLIHYTLGQYVWRRTGENPADPHDPSNYVYTVNEVYSDARIAVLGEDDLDLQSKDTESSASVLETLFYPVLVCAKLPYKLAQWCCDGSEEAKPSTEPPKPSD